MRCLAVPNEYEFEAQRIGSIARIQKDKGFRLRIFKDPLVLLSGLLFFLGGQFGETQNVTNFFGGLASQLEGDLETAEVQEFLDSHKVRGRQQVKEHVVVGSEIFVTDKVLVPLLVHHLCHRIIQSKQT